MSDNKKYYWLKLKEDFFDDDTISWIEEQENGREYCLFYLKLCLKSLKTNGILVRNVGQMLIPYDAKKLGEITNTPADTVMVAMKVFENVGLVQILENGEIYMAQLKNMVGSETKWAEKKRLQRKKAAERLPEPGKGQIEDNVPAMSDRDRDKEIRDKETRDKEREAINYERVINAYNDTCVSFPKLRTLSDNRKKAIKARLHSGFTYEDLEQAFKITENSSFLKGKNGRNWSATFDWIIKDSNLTKILEGNYTDKPGKNPEKQNAQDVSNPFLRRLREKGEI